MYNDISGFIRHQESFRDQEAEFHAGLKALDTQRFKDAIEHYTRCVNLSVGRGLVSTQAAHYFRSLAYWLTGEREKALVDRDRAGTWGQQLAEVPRLAELDALWEERERERKRQQELERHQAARGETDSLDVEIPRFLVQVQGAQGTVAPVTVTVVHESGYRYTQLVSSDKIILTVPEQTTQGRWWLWFGHDGHRPISALKREWPISEALRLESRMGGTDVGVTIESMLYHGTEGTIWRNGDWEPVTD